VFGVMVRACKGLHPDDSLFPCARRVFSLPPDSQQNMTTLQLGIAGRPHPFRAGCDSGSGAHRSWGRMICPGTPGRLPRQGSALIGDYRFYCLFCDSRGAMGGT